MHEQNSMEAAENANGVSRLSRRRFLSAGAASITVAIPLAVAAAPETKDELAQMITEFDGLDKKRNAMEAQIDNIESLPEFINIVSVAPAEVLTRRLDYHGAIDRVHLYRNSEIDDYFAGQLETIKLHGFIKEDSPWPTRLRADWQRAKALFKQRELAKEAVDDKNGIEELYVKSDAIFDEMFDLRNAIVDYPCTVVSHIQAKVDFAERHMQSGSDWTGNLSAMLISMKHIHC